MLHFRRTSRGDGIIVSSLVTLWFGRHNLDPSAICQLRRDNVFLSGWWLTVKIIKKFSIRFLSPVSSSPNQPIEKAFSWWYNIYALNNMVKSLSLHLKSLPGGKRDTRSSNYECSTGDLTIILGLNIVLDHRSSKTINQKILMTLPPPLPPPLFRYQEFIGGRLDIFWVLFIALLTFLPFYLFVVLS